MGDLPYWLMLMLHNFNSRSNTTLEWYLLLTVVVKFPCGTSHHQSRKHSEHLCIRIQHNNVSKPPDIFISSKIMYHHCWECRKTLNIRCIISRNFNDYHLFLQVTLSNLLKRGVKSRMKMQLEQRRQVMLQLHLSDQQCYCPRWCDLY